MLVRTSEQTLNLFLNTKANSEIPKFILKYKSEYSNTKANTQIQITKQTVPTKQIIVAQILLLHKLHGILRINWISTIVMYYNWQC